MPVDTSIYQNIQQPQSPLAMVGQYAGLQHQIGENQLQQQQISQRIALGRAIQSSTNPDGSINTNLLTRTLSQDPNGARIALDAQRESQQGNALTSYMGRNAQGQPTPMQSTLPTIMGMGNPGQQVPQQPQPSQDDIDKMHAHNSAIIKTLTPLASDDNLNQKKVIRGVTDLVADPDADFNATDAATTLSGMPSGPGGQPAPAPVLKAAVNQQLQKQLQIKQVLQTKYPSTNMKTAQATAASLASGGTTTTQTQQPTSGNWTQPQNAEPEQVQNPQNQHDQPQPPQKTEDQSTPGTATGLPVGYAANQSERQKHYLDVQNGANSVPQENAALNNILNISKKFNDSNSPAESGTMIGQIYEALASTGLAPKGIEDTGAQLKILQNHAAQVTLAGGVPGSNERLEALQNAKVGDKDLPQVIQAMVPYLLAVNNGKLAQASYYQKAAGDGTNPTTVASAQQNWTQNFDPRLVEMRQLSSNPAELKKYVAGLSKEDKAELLRKNNAAQDLGMLPDLRNR